MVLGHTRGPKYTNHRKKMKRIPTENWNELLKWQRISRRDYVQLVLWRGTRKESCKFLPIDGFWIFFCFELRASIFCIFWTARLLEFVHFFNSAPRVWEFFEPFASRTSSRGQNIELPMRRFVLIGRLTIMLSYTLYVWVFLTSEKRTTLAFGILFRVTELQNSRRRLVFYHLASGTIKGG